LLQAGADLLAGDALGALPPLELDRVQAVLVEHILGHAEARVLDVHLHEDLAVALMVALVRLDPAVHFRRALDLAVLVEHQLRVDAAGVLAADHWDYSQLTAVR